jgi:recombination protein RecA
MALGVGGYPRGTLVEVFGRESTGKTAMTLYTMAEVHKRQGFTALINLESGITQEGWLNWAVSIAPPGFDPERLVIVDASRGSESLKLFSKMIASNAFDVIVYDSIGAMATDKELEIGEKKQSYGQSAMVTQLIKQAAEYAYNTQCVPILLNQIRDDAAGNYVLEKAPGGHAKDHFATIRLHLKPSFAQISEVKVEGGDEVKPYFRVTARVVKNKVGQPRRAAGWNFWNYPSPNGVVGIDTFQDTVDTALRWGVFEQAGAWYRSDLFPDGKLQGGAAVVNFLRENPQLMEEVRQKLVAKAYTKQTTEKETLVDAV